MQAEPPRRPRAMAAKRWSRGGLPTWPARCAWASRILQRTCASSAFAGTSCFWTWPWSWQAASSYRGRRWEPNDSGRRPTGNYPGPPPAEPLDPPPRRSDTALGTPRDFPDRSLRGPDRRDERGPPTRVSGTNNIPIGSRPSGYASDHSASNVARSPIDRFRPANDYGDLPPRPPVGGPEPFDRRRPVPPPDLLTPGPPRGDRGSRRPSVGHDDAIRPRGPEPMIEPPPHSLPPRPRDGANSRQSRFGPNAPPPNAPPDDQPRIWQTRDEAQSTRPQDRASDVRSMREYVCLDISQISRAEFFITVIMVTCLLHATRTDGMLLRRTLRAAVGPRVIPIDRGARRFQTPALDLQRCLSATDLRRRRQSMKAVASMDPWSNIR
ncbi:hypothetical protein NUW54_g14077 [Trametes sanguinea]|uniref:Uncharacterized protein n=1 Tax=Trametes sanguinea TaxID=158606 RepID=A0ACC1MFE6_9APHY|nr:hypothetical protein NUW54_g14077 [Trametes sanguinea]